MSAANNAKVEARVVDGALVASFMNATPPKVWRADMTHLNSATLELRVLGATHVLVMKNATTEETVASFNEATAAADALQAVTQAMMGPSVSLGAAATGAKKSSLIGGFFKFIFKLVFWVIGVAIALYIAFNLFVSGVLPKVLPEPGDRSTMASPVKEGAPVSADEMFGE